MIKFFRKIRQNLLMENKTGKYFKYAIGEIILVMIGILLALQVNNWNNENKDRISERKILDNIHRDFLTNKVRFDSLKAIHYRSAVALDSMIALLIRSKLKHLESIVKASRKLDIMHPQVLSKLSSVPIHWSLLGTKSCINI